MILPDWHIIHAIQGGWIGVDPFVEENIQPASIDLRLANTFRTFRYQSRIREFIDLRDKQDVMGPELRVDVDDGRPFILASGQFALGSTIERVRIPSDIQAVLDGKSSLARLGLLVHVTGGFFDPGFEGTCTLELHNLAPLAMKIYPGMRICQMSFCRMQASSRHPYGSAELGSKYQGQSGPTASEVWRDFERVS